MIFAKLDKTTQVLNGNKHKLPSNSGKETFWISSNQKLTEFIIRKNNQTKSKSNEIIFSRNSVCAQRFLNSWDVVDDESNSQAEWNCKINETVVFQKIEVEKTQISRTHGHQIEKLHDNQVNKVDG